MTIPTSGTYAQPAARSGAQTAAQPAARSGACPCILLTAVNARFTHTGLAVWCLKAALDEALQSEGLMHRVRVEVLERTIQDSREVLLREIMMHDPSLIGFSCYIWNISLILELCRLIRILSPETQILLGGPEVSFEPEDLLKCNPAVDAVLCGEGETAFSRLVVQMVREQTGAGALPALSACLPGTRPRGFVYRLENGAITGLAEYLRERSLDALPSPYTNELCRRLPGRMAYIETTRGCPFRCSYCLSSATGAVRERSLEHVYQDLSRLVTGRATRIKFTDRTFNFDTGRAEAIWSFVSGMDTDLNFHFEVDAALLDDRLLQVLKKAPRNRIQLEAGIQTLHPAALHAVRRREDQRKAMDHIRTITADGNIHVHISLIAGLPEDGSDTFFASLEQVFSTRPHQVQLGTLKLLKGSTLREEAANRDCRYDPMPPYEVLSTPALPYNELLALKDIARLVEAYWNVPRARRLLSWIQENGRIRPVADLPLTGDSKTAGLPLAGFLSGLAGFFHKRQLFSRPLAVADWYLAMMDHIETCFAEAERQGLQELLLLDALAREGPGGVPQRLFAVNGMPEGIPQRGIRGEPACRERTSRKHRDWLVFCARGEAGAFAQAGLNPQIPDRRVWFQEFRTDGPAFITLLKERGKAQVGERSTKEATETEFPRMAAVVFHMEQHDPVNGTYPTILLEGWEC